MGTRTFTIPATREIPSAQLNLYEIADQLDAGKITKCTVFVDSSPDLNQITDIHGGFRGLPGIGRPKTNAIVIVTYTAFQTADAAAPKPKAIETDCQASYDKANYYQQGTRSLYKFTKKLTELYTNGGSGTVANPYKVVALKRTKNQPEPRLVMISQTYATALSL
jgi:hypothetical protein